MFADRREGSGRLLIQSKLFLDRADDLDSVISKFAAFTAGLDSDPSGQGRLDYDHIPDHFLTVTLSKMGGILKKYAGKHYSSKQSYNPWSEAKRFHIIDGIELLEVLRSAHQKLGGQSSDFTIAFDTPVVHSGNVYIGAVASSELRRLYDQLGDALFFENIRDFIGTDGEGKKGRPTPNAEIIRTIVDAPDQMLARNNGIVLGAESVVRESDQVLLLKDGNLLNGCQTTMCLVQHSNGDARVLVKVVETDKPWDIAKAANHQNYVADIDLDLAQHIRPQLARRAAAAFGITLTGKTVSAFQVIDELYSRKVTYDETRLLFIGLFSRTPNNVYQSSYGDLLNDVIEALYREDTYGERVFDALFTLQSLGTEAAAEAEQRFTNEAYAPLFQRLYKAERPAYRVYVCILALCALLKIDITASASDNKKQKEKDELDIRRQIIDQVRGIVHDERTRYLRYYRHALKSWMNLHLSATVGSDSKDYTLQQMYERSRRASFSQLYRSTMLAADDDDELKKTDSTSVTR